MSTRTMMIMRADLQRAVAGGNDAYGHTVPSVFTTLGTVACYAWSHRNHNRTVDDQQKVALIEEWEMLVPKTTDVTELDRVANIRDRLSVILFAGPLTIRAIERRPTHLHIILRQVD